LTDTVDTPYDAMIYMQFIVQQFLIIPGVEMIEDTKKYWFMACLNDDVPTCRKIKWPG